VELKKWGSPLGPKGVYRCTWVMIKQRIAYTSKILPVCDLGYVGREGGRGAGISTFC
jgi:hypothetical protein